MISVQKDNRAKSIRIEDAIVERFDGAHNSFQITLPLLATLLMFTQALQVLAGPVQQDCQINEIGAFWLSLCKR
jgi:hypothetical protein